MLLFIRRIVILIILLIINSSIQMVKNRNFYDPIYDVGEDDQFADQVARELENEDFQFKTENVWHTSTITSSITLKSSFCESSRTKKYKFTDLMDDELFLTTTKILLTKENQFLDYSNLSFWETFALEFDPCLHMRNRFHQFQMILVSKDLFRLSNVTVSVHDHSAVTGLLKTYYDVALWRISTLRNLQQQDHCFHMLNKFFCIIQIENLYQLKLQSVACHRLHLLFQPQFSPQYEADTYLFVERKVENVCNPPDSDVYIKFDNKAYIHSNVPIDLELNEVNYFEEGCFEFFIKRMQQKPTFYRENDLVAASPNLCDSDLTLTFPDGTVISSNATTLLYFIQKYYRCQLLEILAIKRKENRLCFLNLFHQNMDKFITTATQRLKAYALDIDELTAFQSMTRWQKNIIKAYAQKFEPSSLKEPRFKSVPWMTTCSIRSSLFSLWPSSTSSSSSTALSFINGEKAAEAAKFANHHLYTTASYKESQVLLEAMKHHIFKGLCIIICVAFAILIFMCFFTIWLSYMSKVARLKQEQEKIELLRSLRTDNSF